MKLYSEHSLYFPTNYEHIPLCIDSTVSALTFPTSYKHIQLIRDPILGTLSFPMYYMYIYYYDETTVSIVLKS